MTFRILCSLSTKRTCLANTAADDLLKMATTKQQRATMSSSTSQVAASVQEYKDTILEGIFAERRGDNRVAADKYLQAFLMAPSKLADQRMGAWNGYFKILGGEETGPTPQDIRQLKQVARDRDEHVLFRCRALYLLGILKAMTEDFIHEERAAEYLRLALDINKTATASDRNAEIIPYILHDGTASTESVGHFLDDDARMAGDILYMVENPSHGEKRPGIPLFNGQPNPSFVRRCRVSGSECDCCLKRRTDVDGGLWRCSRCKKAWYCSQVCQERQWNAGHNKACRAKGQIEEGDYMVLRGIVRQPQLNGSLGQVIKPVDGGRWQVKVEGRRTTLAVTPDKLAHIRPIM